MIKFGIDLDNTIVDYGNIFYEYALKLKFIKFDNNNTKEAIKNKLKKDINGEYKWNKLQSIVYSVGMTDALIMEGCAEFIRMCRNLNYDLVKKAFNFPYFKKSIFYLPIKVH